MVTMLGSRPLRGRRICHGCSSITEGVEEKGPREWVSVYAESGVVLLVNGAQCKSLRMETTGYHHASPAVSPRCAQKQGLQQLCGRGVQVVFASYSSVFGGLFNVFGAVACACARRVLAS